ncbi:hypothetical protein [Lysinibacillus yapensis]|uniref:hypothetical protein n=1 Tax=Ureibacillus yapensis TaxID=2304605 RepID=UPI001314E43B|nr:hypothetical protein [Lysinibacillus yapensis]
MDTEKNKPSAPHLDEDPKSNHETNDNELHQNIKETIERNKKLIEKNHEILHKK